MKISKKILSILLFFCFSITQASATEECTIGVALGKATPDGRPMIWKTRDGSDNPDNTVKYETGANYKFIYVVNAGSTISAWMGVNEHGFAIVNSSSTDLPTNETGSGLLNGPTMKHVLGICKTVADFENYLKSTNSSGRRTSANYAVMDAKGNAAIFETGGNKYYKYDAKDTAEGYIIRANFAINGGGSGGLDRFNRSTALVSGFYQNGKLDYESIIRLQMRDFATSSGLKVNIPYKGNWNSERPYGYIYSANAICRSSSVSTAVIHGVKSSEDPKLTTMWTMLGNPATTISLPYWPVGDLPTAVKGNPNSSLNDKANAIRALLYNYSENSHYLNSFLLKDLNGEGLFPHLFALEDSIFAETKTYVNSLRSKSSISSADISNMRTKQTNNAQRALNNLQRYLNKFSPKILTSPSSLDFGYLLNGTTKKLTFTVDRQDLSRDITISSDNAAFTVSPSTLNQSGGTVTVTFKPTTAVGLYSGTLTLKSSGAPNKTVALEGRGYTATRTWSGAEGVNWNNKNNWEEGSTPTSASNVLIPKVDTNNYPELRNDTTTIKKITINSGATLNMQDKALVIMDDEGINNYGTIRISGDLPSNQSEYEGTVTFYGGSQMRTRASTKTTFNKIIVESGNFLARYRVVTKTLQVKAGGIFDMQSYTLELKDSPSISNKGTIRSSYPYRLPVLSGGYEGTVDFYGTSEQNGILGDITFENLLISGSKVINAQGKITVTGELNINSGCTLDMGTNALDFGENGTYDSNGTLRLSSHFPGVIRDYGGIVEVYGSGSTFRTKAESGVTRIYNHLIIENGTTLEFRSISRVKTLEVKANATLDSRANAWYLNEGGNGVINKGLIKAKYASRIPATTYGGTVEIYGDDVPTCNGPSGASTFATLKLLDGKTINAKGDINITSSLDIPAGVTLDMAENTLTVPDNGLTNQGILRLSSNLPVNVSSYGGDVIFYGSDDMRIPSTSIISFKKLSIESGKVRVNWQIRPETLYIASGATCDLQRCTLRGNVQNEGTLRTTRPNVIPVQAYGGLVQFDIRETGTHIDCIDGNTSFNQLEISGDSTRILVALGDIAVSKSLNISSNMTLDIGSYKLTVPSTGLTNDGTLRLNGSLPTTVKSYGGTVEFYHSTADITTPANTKFNTILVNTSNAKKLKPGSGFSATNINTSTTGFFDMSASTLTLSPTTVTNKGTIDIGAGKLNVSDNLINTGRLRTSNNLPNIANFDGTVEYYGTGNQTIHPASYNNLELLKSGKFSLADETIIKANNLTLSSNSNLEIDSKQTVEISSKLTNPKGKDGILIKADKDKPAGTLIFNNTTTEDVYATVEMFANGSWKTNSQGEISNPKWQYFGIPFHQLDNITNLFNGAIINKYNPSGKGTSTFPVETGRWIQQNSSNTLSSVDGYAISQLSPKKYTLSGKLFNDDIVRQITYNATADYPGQHILSNPYTAAINIKNIEFSSGLDSTIYIYNSGGITEWGEQAGTAYSDAIAFPGQYIASPVKICSGQSGIPTQIPSMQAFLVKTKASSAGTLKIYYKDVVQNTRIQRAPEEPNAWLRMTLNSENSGGDVMWIISEPTTTYGFDNGWDGLKITGDADRPMLFVSHDAVEYQISAQPDIHDTNIAFKAGSDNEEYTITFHKGGGMENLYEKIYLIDKDKNAWFDVTENGSTYSFTSNNQNINSRFKILTQINEDDFSTGVKDVYVFADKNKLFINNISNENAVIDIFDVSGRLMLSYNCKAGDRMNADLNIPQGSYLVRITSSKIDNIKIMVK